MQKEVLQFEIQAGLDNIAQGEFTDYNDASLLQLFETIKKRGRERLKALKPPAKAAHQSAESRGHSG
jgi:hypothetical protein